MRSLRSPGELCGSREVSREFLSRGLQCVIAGSSVLALSNALGYSFFTKQDAIVELLVLLFLFSNFRSWEFVVGAFSPVGEIKTRTFSVLSSILLKSAAVLLLAAILLYGGSRGAVQLVISLLTFLFGGVIASACRHKDVFVA